MIDVSTAHFWSESRFFKRQQNVHQAISPTSTTDNDVIDQSRLGTRDF